MPAPPKKIYLSDDDIYEIQRLISEEIKKIDKYIIENYDTKNISGCEYKTMMSLYYEIDILHDLYDKLDENY